MLNKRFTEAQPQTHTQTHTHTNFPIPIHLQIFIIAHLAHTHMHLHVQEHPQMHTASQNTKRRSNATIIRHNVQLEWVT